MAVIELDLDTPPAPASRGPRAHRYRGAGLLLAGALTLVLGGAAPVASALWQRLGVIPLGSPEASFALIGGRVYTVDPAGEGRWRTTAWDAPSLRRAWISTTGAVRRPSEASPYGGVSLTEADGTLLVAESSATSVVDARTGAVRWTTPGPVQAVTPRLGVTVETRFRPGTEYDMAGGEPGDLFFSATGEPHTEPPSSTTLHGVDLTTGRRLWTSEQRGALRTARASGATPGVVVVASDRLMLLAPDTGTVRRETPLPRAGSVSSVEFAGDLVLIRSGPMDEPGTLAAYAMDTLAFRWSTADAPDGGEHGWCLGLPCARDRSGVTVLDPRSGQPAWRASSGLSLVRSGDAVLEVGTDIERVMQVRDLAGGAVRAQLPSWETVVNWDVDGPLVMRRTERDRRVTAFGALLPGGSGVQPLGVAGSLVDDCVADARLIACRTGVAAEVWSYRT